MPIDIIGDLCDFGKLLASGQSSAKRMIANNSEVKCDMHTATMIQWALNRTYQSAVVQVNGEGTPTAGI